ncbi:hypothetical protein BOTBODRAFT_107436 [Botryobasidium botryosum FD-172 SS1]|uniref:Uncharacterized protein n=1 Tax=Botryobasidium botryosum (strain FD-172 SS1) TaxID=930990 RepID=A0A067MKW1_BOTB1|nr:hypothetical protein BOTBODRAFT_107436 [Botryobasidium botryosum FD-172 SS1]
MLSLYDKRGPLHHAVRYHSLAAVRLLLDSGANPNLQGGWCGAPLCDAVEYAWDDDDHDIVKALLQGGADVNGAARRPLHVASERGHTSTVRLLLESGADPHLSGYDVTALHAAAWGRDCTATFSALLGAGADPNTGDEAGRTALHYAVLCHQSPAVIQLLLDGGADPRIHDSNGGTALHYALRDRGCTTTILLSALLEAGADPNARDDNGLMSLHYAVQWRSPPITQLLLKAGADPDSRDNKGRTPLFCALIAAESTHTRWLEHAAALCDAGANIDCPDNQGITPLYDALRCARQETIFSLLQLGADPFAGREGILVSPRAIVGLIGNVNMEAILAFVTRVRFRPESTSFAQDQCVSYFASYLFIPTYLFRLGFLPVHE